MKSIPPLFIGAIVVGAALRLFQANESLWADELHTSWAVTGSLAEVAERAAIGNQAPLYFWLVWFSSRLPIMPEIAIRLPSLIAGCCLPVAMFWLTKKLLPKTAEAVALGAPLLAAWLTALDARGIFYSQEARPYALLQLVAVLHIGALLDLFTSQNWRRRAWWIISGALLVHLHYTAGLVLVAEFLAVVIWLGYFARNGARLHSADHSRYVKAFSRQFVIDFALLGLLLLPTVPAMLEVGTRRENWNAFVERHPPIFDLLRIFPWTMASVFLWFAQSQRRVFEAGKLNVLFCWLLAPQLIAWLATTTGLAPLFYSRYLLSSWPASLIAAALFSHVLLTPALQRLYAAAILAMHLWLGGMLVNWYQDGRLLHDRHEDWRAATRTLEAAVQSSPQAAVVLVRAGLIEADELRRSDDPLLREYCLLPIRGMYRIESRRGDEFYPLPYNDPGKLSPQLRDRLLKADEVLLLDRSSKPEDREQLLVDLQGSLGKGVRLTLEEEPAEFGGVYLQRIVLKPKASQR